MFGGGVFLLLQPNSSYLINSEYSIFYTGLLILEVFFILISFFLLCILEYLMFAKKAFHLNHTIIIALFSLVYIPASAVRIWFISKILTGQGFFVPFSSGKRLQILLTTFPYNAQSGLSMPTCWPVPCRQLCWKGSLRLFI